MIPDCFSLKYLANWSPGLNYSIQAEAADANLPLMQCGRVRVRVAVRLVPLGQSMGWYVWMWQKVPPIDIFWHVTLVNICQAHVTLNEKKRGQKNTPPPSLPPSAALPAQPRSTLSSKRQADILKVCYFASAGTDCSGSFVLEALAECVWKLFALKSSQSSTYKASHIVLVHLNLLLSLHCFSSIIQAILVQPFEKCRDPEYFLFFFSVDKSFDIFEGKDTI